MYIHEFIYAMGGGKGGRPSSNDGNDDNDNDDNDNDDNGNDDNDNDDNGNDGNGNDGNGEKWYVVCYDGKINVTKDPDTERCEVLTEPFDSESDAWDWANDNFPSLTC